MITLSWQQDTSKYNLCYDEISRYYDDDGPEMQGPLRQKIVYKLIGP